MSHGENGVPVVPDWFLDPALERCIGCNKAKVSCEADVHHGSKCCGFCSHFIPVEMKMPAVWMGDQA